MTGRLFAVVGTTEALDPRERSALFDRATSSDDSVRLRTAELIRRVRAEGDLALRAFAREFDEVDIEALEVPRRAWRDALDSLNALDAPLVRALERAADNIRAVHVAFRPSAQTFTTVDGVQIGRRPDPLARVGVYAPGGRAAYPSSLLMGVVPARVAGVGEVVVCSPPDSTGTPNAVVLAAAQLANVDRLFAVGGAGAIAAFAFGTDTIPAVDRIVGPGNAYVAEAKVQLASVVGIDSPAGPSELLIIADDSASPAVIAGELLAQAEHDPLAAVVVVSTFAPLLDAVELEMRARLLLEPRADVIVRALGSRGALLLAPSIDAAIEFSNRWAPEHLLITARNPESVRDRVRNAGTVFLGAAASVAFGDYLTGANHVLPTGGSARAWSGLSTTDFYRWTTWQVISQNAAAALAVDVGLLADAEGLPSHAAAARQWEVPLG